MRALASLFRAGFRHQASFRFAIVSGLFTNAFFGIVRSAVFLAVYRAQEPSSSGTVGGLDVADALTYVWILQASFSVMWAPWVHELPTRIRSGEWTAELTRPGPVLARHLAYDFGRAISMLCFRAPLPILVAAVVFDLRLPTTVGGVALLVLSLVLAAFVATCIRFLVGSIAFWTPDFRGVYSMIFGPVWLLSGFVIPVEYFPDGLRELSIVGPLGATLRAPVAIATGREVAVSLVLQGFWCVAFVGVCALVLERATRRVVAFGG